MKQEYTIKDSVLALLSPSSSSSVFVVVRPSALGVRHKKRQWKLPRDWVCVATRQRERLATHFLSTRERIAEKIELCELLIVHRPSFH